MAAGTSAGARQASKAGASTQQGPAAKVSCQVVDVARAVSSCARCGKLSIWKMKWNACASFSGTQGKAAASAAAVCQGGWPDKAGAFRWVGADLADPKTQCVLPTCTCTLPAALPLHTHTHCTCTLPAAHSSLTHNGPTCFQACPNRLTRTRRKASTWPGRRRRRQRPRRLLAPPRPHLRQLRPRSQPFCLRMCGCWRSRCSRLWQRTRLEPRRPAGGALVTGPGAGARECLPSLGPGAWALEPGPWSAPLATCDGGDLATQECVLETAVCVLARCPSAARANGVPALPGPG